MTKYHPYPRRALRSLFKTWLKMQRLRVAVMCGAAVALVALETWVLSVLGLPHEVRWYLVGFVHAAVVAAVMGGICISFLVHERGAIWQMRGAWGEDFTRDELQRARRKRLIWGWVDSVTLQNGDIDHLVVTKAGGLVAVDSKWRSSPDDLDPAAMASEAKRAKMRAEGVVQTILRAERGTHRAAARSVTVTPLIVVWGDGQHSVPRDARVAGVDFVPGRELLDWLSRTQVETVDELAAADLLTRLERFRTTTWTNAQR
jgi:hypothetical protein